MNTTYELKTPPMPDFKIGDIVYTFGPLLKLQTRILTGIQLTNGGTAYSYSTEVPALLAFTQSKGKSAWCLSDEESAEYKKLRDSLGSEAYETVSLADGDATQIFKSPEEAKAYLKDLAEKLETADTV